MFKNKIYPMLPGFLIKKKEGYPYDFFQNGLSYFCIVTSNISFRSATSLYMVTTYKPALPMISDFYRFFNKKQWCSFLSD